MFLKTSTALKIDKESQIIPVGDNYYNSHYYDYNRDMTNKQKTIIDLVTNKNGGDTNPAYSPLLNLIFNNSVSQPISAVSSTDKEILMEAWSKSASSVDGKRIDVSEEVDHSKLNLLKSKGLICGNGRSVSFTPSGKKLIIDMILNSDSTISAAANSLNKMIKTCAAGPDGVNVKGLKRRPDGSWEKEKKDTRPIPLVRNMEEEESRAQNGKDSRPIPTTIARKTDDELKKIYKEVTEAKNTYSKYKYANKENLWHQRYDINKLVTLSEQIEKEVERRKNTKKKLKN